MKRLKSPVVSVTDKNISLKKNSIDQLKTDRSYLPSMSDSPVAKCGCT